MTRYVAVPVEVGTHRYFPPGEGGKAAYHADVKVNGRVVASGTGLTEEEAFAELAKLGYKEAKEPSISDKMRDVAQWYDHLCNARHATDNLQGDLLAWAHSIEVCEGKK